MPLLCLGACTGTFTGWVLQLLVEGNENEQSQGGPKKSHCVCDGACIVSCAGWVLDWLLHWPVEDTIRKM